MTDKTGGPAFPAPGTTGYEKDGVVTFVNWPGMTLRDYFAAKALPALVTIEEYVTTNDLPRIANVAYLLADAMLAERAK